MMPAAAALPGGAGAQGGAGSDNRPPPGASAPAPSLAPHAVKTFDIEVQRLVSATHDKGAIDIGLQALVLPRSGHGGPPDSTLRLPVEHARTLMLLLKERLAELDKLQPRSRRSGRH